MSLIVCRTWTNYLIDASIYPIMASTSRRSPHGILSPHAGTYIISVTGLEDSWQWTITQSIVLFIVLLRLSGFDMLVKFSTTLTLLSVIPAVLFVLACLPYINPSLWFDSVGKFNCTAPQTEVPLSNIALGLSCEPAEEVRWGTFFPFTLWLWSGVFDLGSIAGEVKNPRRTIPLALFFLVPLVVVEVVVPLALAVSVDPNQSNYYSGHYANIARAVAGKWLDVLLTTAAITCLLGTCNASTIISDEAIQSFCLRHRPLFFARQSTSASALRRWLFDTNHRIAPVFVRVNGTVLCMSVAMPFNLLISSSMMIMNVSLMLFFVAYVVLKRRNPEANWLYHHNWRWAAACVSLPAMVTLVMTFYAMTDNPMTYGIPYINAVTTLVIVGFGFLAHVVLWLALRWLSTLAPLERDYYRKLLQIDEDTGV